jgi:hypothetical protein
VFVEHDFKINKSLNLPPQTMMSWNVLAALAHYVGRIA